MSNVDDLFKASAESFWQTMTCHAGSVGFRIPDFQRQYNWDRENISRLFEDICNGIFQLNSSNESYTFLGTIIVVAESDTEPSYDGKSLAIVDGQQRLTTLALTACALVEAINVWQEKSTNLARAIEMWIEEEVDLQINELHKCAVGQISKGRGEFFHYPRLVRSSMDVRAKAIRDIDYKSNGVRFSYGVILFNNR